MTLSLYNLSERQAMIIIAVKWNLCKALRNARLAKKFNLSLIHSWDHAIDFSLHSFAQLSCACLLVSQHIHSNDETRCWHFTQKNLHIVKWSSNITPSCTTYRCTNIRGKCQVPFFCLTSTAAVCVCTLAVHSYWEFFTRTVWLSSVSARNARRNLRRKKKSLIDKSRIIVMCMRVQYESLGWQTLFTYQSQPHFRPSIHHTLWEFKSNYPKHLRERAATGAAPLNYFTLFKWLVHKFRIKIARLVDDKFH